MRRVYTVDNGNMRQPTKLWIFTTILFFALSVIMLVIALHCSKMLECVYNYRDEETNVLYCVSEIK